MDIAKASMIRNMSWCEELHSPYKSPHQSIHTTNERHLYQTSSNEMRRFLKHKLQIFLMKK